MEILSSLSQIVYVCVLDRNHYMMGKILIVSFSISIPKKKKNYQQLVIQKTFRCGVCSALCQRVPSSKERFNGVLLFANFFTTFLFLLFLCTTTVYLFICNNYYLFIYLFFFFCSSRIQEACTSNNDWFFGDGIHWFLCQVDSYSN